MKNNDSHKFDNKRTITYREHFKNRFGILSEITNEFCTVIEKDKALLLIRNLADKQATEGIKKLVEKNPISNFDDFKNFFKKQLQSELFSNALTYTIKEDTEDTLEFEITECLWATAFKELENTELGYQYSCHPDFAMAKAYNRDIELIRTKTLMQGHDCCNHCYKWKKEKK